MVNEKHTAEIIRMIRRLREMEIDVETVEQIVDMLGMKEQLLTQLQTIGKPVFDQEKVRRLLKETKTYLRHKD